MSRRIWDCALAFAVLASVARVASSGEDLSTLVECVRWGVVLVSTDKGTGTGWIADGEGHVVTNYHVIQESGVCEVYWKRISDSDPKKCTYEKVKVRIVAADPARDLAILRMEVSQEKRGEWKPVITAAGAPLKAGQAVFVIGNPGHGSEILEDTVTSGIISNPRQSLDGRTFIQTTAAVNPGNSGGPLFNQEGQVIGVVTLKGKNVEGVAFAAPVAEALDLLKRREEAPFRVEEGRLASWEERSAGSSLIHAPQEFAPIVIPQAKEIESIVWHPGLKRILAFDPQANAIHLIDPEKGAFEKTVFAGSGPVCFDVSGAGSVAVVANAGGKKLEWRDLRKEKVLKGVDLPFGDGSARVVAVDEKSAIVTIDPGLVLHVFSSGKISVLASLLEALKPEKDGPSGFVVEPAYASESGVLLLAQVTVGTMKIHKILLKKALEESAASKADLLKDFVEAMKPRPTERLSVQEQGKLLFKRTGLMKDMVFGQECEPRVWTGERYCSDRLCAHPIVRKNFTRMLCSGNVFDLKSLELKGNLKRVSPSTEKEEGMARELRLKRLLSYSDTALAVSPDGKWIVCVLAISSAQDLRLARMLPFPIPAATFDGSGKWLFMVHPLEPVVYRAEFERLVTR